MCLAAVPGGPVDLQGPLDTGKSELCLKKQPASWADTQPAACIITGGTVTISSLNVTGPRPLVVVAHDQITVTALLDVASHRATAAVGAGSGPTDCQPFGRNAADAPAGGGGAGGSFMFPGGDGGTGDGVNHQGGLAPSSDVGAPSRLRGGCPGQPGGGGKPNDGGAGGGAVYLVSAGTIAVSGTIDASGAGGVGGDAQDGGGGGGSGGMIVLYGAQVTTASTTLLIADGGGGGGGGANSGLNPRGSNGQDPMLATPIAAALGGPGGILIGFTGGDGGNGYATGSAATPGLSGDTGAGGGGGGGGGGYIQSNRDLGAAALSPAASIQP